MAGLKKLDNYLVLTDDNGEVISRQRRLTVVSNMNEPIQARVTVIINPEQIDDDIEELTLYYKGKEPE